MSAALLDVNMLIALAWPSHVHHRVAHKWFAANRSEGWATCPFTQCGFVRVSSNPRSIREAVEPKEALLLLVRLVTQAHHVFWPDDIALRDDQIPAGLLVSHSQITDAYLLGLAIHRKGKLVTLDRGVAALLPANSANQSALVVLSAKD